MVSDPRHSGPDGGDERPEPASGPQVVEAPRVAAARFGIGEIVRHRFFDFRGVIFDVDPVFANTEEWYQAIPQQVRPRKDQPFYHLFAESGENAYVAYVSQQNLLADPDNGPVDHPAIGEVFETFAGKRYRLRSHLRH